MRRIKFLILNESESKYTHTHTHTHTKYNHFYLIYNAWQLRDLQ